MTKSAHTRASLLPYPIIAAAVAGDAEAVSRVVRHYSSYIAALSTRTSYGSDGYPRLQVDEELRVLTVLLAMPMHFAICSSVIHRNQCIIKISRSFGDSRRSAVANRSFSIRTTAFPTGKAVYSHE